LATPFAVKVVPPDRPVYTRPPQLTGEFVIILLFQP